MNILIKAYSGINFGDDLFIASICKRYEQHQFTLSAEYKYVEIFKHIKNLSINVCAYCDIKENDLKLAKNSDLVVYVGGSIFIEHNKDSLNKTKYLKELIDTNNNFYVVGANFGPFKSKEYYDYVKNETIRHTKGICFRDTYSYNLFKDCDNVMHAPDVIFGLDVNSSLEKEKSIGISVIHHLERESILPFYNQYIEKLKEIIYHFIDMDYKINLLGFCSKEKDNIAIENLLNELDPSCAKNISVYNYNGNIKEFLEVLNKQEYLIATRFHSMILGLKLGAKLLTICYSDKTTNAIKDMNINMKYYKLENVDKLKVEDIIKEKKLNVQHLIDKSHLQFKFLDEILISD
ncbi:MAG: polysaccharide pyruvyl transferase family protein [Clostridia bacterium]|nr:polysaccharide pyruvyl transferase family protein [Clostridia bacterium]